MAFGAIVASGDGDDAAKWLHPIISQGSSNTRNGQQRRMALLVMT
jgi:hypothetical protein